MPLSDTSSSDEEGTSQINNKLQASSNSTTVHPIQPGPSRAGGYTPRTPQQRIPNRAQWGIARPYGAPRDPSRVHGIRYSFGDIKRFNYELVQKIELNTIPSITENQIKVIIIIHKK